MAHGSILGQKLEDALLVDGSKSMQANLNMNNHKITNVTNGTTSADVVNYSQLQTKLSLSGGTMTGPINMGNNKITNVANGTANADIATVGQVNDAVANNISFITASNDDQSGVIISPTSLYVWMDDTLDSTSKNFTKEYNIINKWYNLSGLLSHDKTQIKLTGNNGSSEKTIGWVKFSENNFEVHIDTVYCGFAHFGTFDYHS